jgi:dihydrofolate reductase
MRKIKLFIASSLDGYIAKEDEDTSWLFSDEDYGYKKFYDSIDTVIMGRKTYEKALKLEENPFKEKNCYIFTKNTILTNTDTNTDILKRTSDKNIKVINNVIDFIKSLVNTDGKNIWLVGGSEIISILMNANMVDEIILSIHPLILGNGISLFTKIKRQIKLKVLNSITYNSGLIQIYYKIIS